MFSAKVLLRVPWKGRRTGCNGNHRANVKLLKLGSLMGIRVCEFSQRLRNLETVLWDLLRKESKYDLQRDL